jgi:acyl-CoA synthetase (AMP-forming)/AMP-acid ligase II
MRTGVEAAAETAVPASLLDRAETIPHAIEELVERFPRYECLTLLDRHRNERRVSLETFWTRAKEVQAVVAARGLDPGRCGVVALPTGAELVAAYFGIMLGGGVPVLAPTPSNRVADGRVYTQIVGNVLRNSAAQVLYCDEDVEALFREESAQLGDVAIVRPQDAAPCTKAPDTVYATPDDVATVQYSSGTTGAQKGILLSHRAMLAYTRSLRDGLGLRSEDVSVNWAPLYHDMGLFGAFLLPLLCGCPTVLIPTMDFLRDPALWLWAIHRYRGSLSWAPNFAYSLCAKRVPDSELEGLDLSSWRIAANASEPVLPATVEAFATRFEPYGYAPAAMTAAWGLAEVVMVGTVHPVAEAPLIDRVDRRALAARGRAVPSEGDGFALAATGRCLPGFEMEIRDDAGRVLGDREVGDIWLRSPTVFSGYKDDPELTARVLVDGWIHSGDRGYTVDGHLFFVSRVKDLIIVGGENYAPHDIETAINRVPGVREGCAVTFGVTNEERGTEDLAAVVETREEDPDALRALASAIRAEVMRWTGLGIRHLELVPPGGVEKTTSGKLARRATQLRYADRFDG